jgi:hypothetical protein
VRLLLPLIACLVFAAAAAGADKPPARTCDERIEVGEPIRFRNDDADVVVGRVAFFSLARYADPEEFAEAYDARSGHHAIKSAVVVRANRNVKLSIAPAQRATAGLAYTVNQRRAVPGEQPVVLLSPCRSSQRAFSYRGRVGAATAFSGGLAVSEPTCLVLEARVRGRDPVRRAISLGMGDSCPQP